MPNEISNGYSPLTESPWPRPEYDPDYESACGVVRTALKEALAKLDQQARWDSKVRAALVDVRFYLRAAIEECPNPAGDE